MYLNKTKTAINLSDMREDSIVLVRGSWGSDPAVKATVTNVCSDVKNGRPGIDYIVNSTGDSHWAYLEQVTKVLTY